MNKLFKWGIPITICLISLILYMSGIGWMEIGIFLLFALLGFLIGRFISKRRWGKTYKIVTYCIIIFFVTIINLTLFWLKIPALVSLLLFLGLATLRIVLALVRSKLFIRSLLMLGVSIWFMGLFAKVIYNQWNERKEVERRYNELLAFPSAEECRSFLDLMGNDFVDEYRDRVSNLWLDILIDEVENIDYMSYEVYDTTGKYVGTPLLDLYMFAEDNKSNKFGIKANKHMTHLSDSLYRVADSVSTIRAWRQYEYIIPSEYLLDFESKLQAVDAYVWAQESTAWETVRDLNTIEDYERYLKEYQGGLHAKEVEANLVDLLFAGVYKDKPELLLYPHYSSGAGRTTLVQVTNDTENKLTILYSGVEKKRVIVAQGETISIRLQNGRYMFAAIVDDLKISPSVGSASYNGGTYRFSIGVSQKKIHI